MVTGKKKGDGVLVTLVVFVARVVVGVWRAPFVEAVGLALVIAGLTRIWGVTALLISLGVVLLGKSLEMAGRRGQQ